MHLAPPACLWQGASADAAEPSSSPAAVTSTPHHANTLMAQLAAAASADGDLENKTPIPIASATAGPPNSSPQRAGARSAVQPQLRSSRIPAPGKSGYATATASPAKGGLPDAAATLANRRATGLLADRTNRGGADEAA